MTEKWQAYAQHILDSIAKTLEHWIAVSNKYTNQSMPTQKQTSQPV